MNYEYVKKYSKNRLLFFLGLLSFLIIGCNKLEGEFAFKKFSDDTYKKIKIAGEFNNNERVDWVYSFKSPSGNHSVYVILMKKEIVWVDINTRKVDIDRSKQIIYGIIKNLDVGTYKIMISSEGSVIDEYVFNIYNDDHFDDD